MPLIADTKCGWPPLSLMPWLVNQLSADCCCVVIGRQGIPQSFAAEAKIDLILHIWWQLSRWLVASLFHQIWDWPVRCSEEYLSTSVVRSMKKCCNRGSVIYCSSVSSWSLLGSNKDSTHVCIVNRVLSDRCHLFCCVELYFFVRFSPLLLRFVCAFYSFYVSIQCWF